MASSAAAVRRDIAGELAGVEVDGQAVTVTDHLPETVYPPLVVVSTGDPYLTGDGGAFGAPELGMSLEVYAIAGEGTNDATLDALEQMLEGIAEALPAEFLTASAPFLATIGGLSYLTSRANLTTRYTLTKGT